mmetsp:Transcript_20309/g.50239  ORF Transcript_20309/g.50239 Transcript_20309/m.50239 type:complete len:253 (-) Transcript_20309:442-1200(-)
MTQNGTERSKNASQRRAVVALAPRPLSHSDDLKSSSPSIGRNRARMENLSQSELGIWPRTVPSRPSTRPPPRIPLIDSPSHSSLLLSPSPLVPSPPLPSSTRPLSLSLQYLLGPPHQTRDHAEPFASDLRTNAFSLDERAENVKSLTKKLAVLPAPGMRAIKQLGMSKVIRLIVPEEFEYFYNRELSEEQVKENNKRVEEKRKAQTAQEQAPIITPLTVGQHHCHCNLNERKIWCHAVYLSGPSRRWARQPR